MGHYHHAEEALWQALCALAGASNQRKRLENAYADHLSALQDAELPMAQRAKFSLLRDALTHGRQLHPEITIAGMSDDEVDKLVRQIVELYDAIRAETAAAA
jgi:hypothetical protein